MSGATNPSWRLTANAQGDNSVYRRPLGDTELAFYWDSVFYGAATTIEHIDLEAEPGFGDALFARQNIENTWVRMKRRFPLLAASVDELPGSEVVEFVVDEERLGSIRPKEINYVSVESEDSVERLIDEIQNGAPTLSNDVVAQLWIARQADAPRRVHVVTAVAHYITDGIAGATLIREFCQELSTLSSESRISGPPLPERLKTLLPLEALNPDLSLSRARRRWRAAVAKVIYDLRQTKRTGGHSLPTLPYADAGTPARSRTTTLRLPAPLSQQIIDACRARGITFGNALPVLSQLAHARLLHRRRHGQAGPRIDDAEWAHRLAQPMHFAGPLNLRPYLDRAWYERGGAAEVCLAISFYTFVLPSMPTLPPQRTPSSLPSSPSTSISRWLASGPPRDPDASILEDQYFPPQPSTLLEADRKADLHRPAGPSPSRLPISISRWLASGPPRDPHARIPEDQDLASHPPKPLEPTTDDGTPPFGAFLSPARFLHRARLIRAQSAALLNHPLLHALHAARSPARVARARAAALAWRAKQVGAPGKDVPNTRSHAACVLANGGASLGNRDLLFRHEYPLPSPGSTSNPPARLRLRDTVVHLRCRPSELYLGALMTRGQLEFFSYADLNVYDAPVVREWMEAVRDAAVYYLSGGAETTAQGGLKPRL